jgi:hypothetical protein
MKDKVLQAQITESVEKIAKSLRFYSKEPIFCKITISSRDEALSDNPDYYQIKVEYAHYYDRGDEPIFMKKARIDYEIEGKYHELIRRVTVFKEEGEEDE